MDVQRRTLTLSVVAIATTFMSATWAESPPLLPPDQAFPLQVVFTQKGKANLSWDIPKDYYLYQHSIQVQQNQHKFALDLPPAKATFDENFGHTQIYEHDLSFTVALQPSSQYVVTWQGCAKDRLCYPPQHIEFSTDVDALVQLNNPTQPSASLMDLAGQAALPNTEASTDSDNAFVTEPVAADQRWSAKLNEHSFAYSLVLFFGLGILLAFTPCSLPMLPILSSLIVRDRKGLAAWMIALAFVSSMALVYAILGLVASSAGLGFQRWLQQPSTLIAFSALFVLFALNLFGVFELRLPQGLVKRLDRLQGMQKGGSLVSASIMGMLSALLVGPCMTAPLAGALLFISQTQQQWQGAVLLFVLGFGMGTPLLFASVLGSRVLPKAGQWMNQVKILFGFIMLAVALYFVRPLLSGIWLQAFSFILALSFIVYVTIRLWQSKTRVKWLYVSVLLVSVPALIYQQYQYFSTSQSVLKAESQVWQVARNSAEFHQILANAPSDQAIVIDVYADWCVACQPIEHRILKSDAVQQSLSDVMRIKLDLSHYDASHQALLNEWEILGPPTYLFLTAQQQEVRGLRLTGAFSEDELLQRLQQLKTQN